MARTITIAYGGEQIVLTEDDDTLSTDQIVETILATIDVYVGDIEPDVSDLIQPVTRGALGTLLWLADADPAPGVYVPNLSNLPDYIVVAVQDEVTDFLTANAADCRAYVEALAPHAVAEYDGQTSADWAAESIGHDFILTRNHHGAGFWDRGLGDLGDRLTQASHPYGETSLDVADDGSLHLLG